MGLHRCEDLWSVYMGVPHLCMRVILYMYVHVYVHMYVHYCTDGYLGIPICLLK